MMIMTVVLRLDSHLEVGRSCPAVLAVDAEDGTGIDITGADQAIVISLAGGVMERKSGTRTRCRYKLRAYGQ
jgi:hypothetical protein